jgi:hypothetical protein
MHTATGEFKAADNSIIVPQPLTIQKPAVLNNDYGSCSMPSSLMICLLIIFTGIAAFAGLL